MRRLALLAVVAASGCGPDSALWVRVEAPLSVPGDCDAVRLEAHRGQLDGPIIFERTFALADDKQFPLTLSLGNHNPANLGDSGVTVQATALRGGEPARPWAKGSAWATLTHGQFSELTVRLCDCP